MKIEKWIYKGEEIEVPVCEKEDIEQNEYFDLENTLDLTKELEHVGDNNE